MPNEQSSDAPVIQLTFGPAGSKTWDDQELILAYNEAMSEFHAHHPGPGSWLDKATAALAVGKPLPGTHTFGTQWYAAQGQPESSAAAAVDRRPQKRKRPTEAGPVTNKSNANPYINTKKTTVTNAQAPPSPTYNPPSPRSRASESPDFIAPAEVPYEGEEEELPFEPVTEPSTVPSAMVSEEQAIGYAMQAQYMAGYWMGIAQARKDASAPSQYSGHTADTE